MPKLLTSGIYRTGDQHPSKEGFVFLRYGRKSDGKTPREEWVTPERLEEFRKTVCRQTRERTQTPEGRKRSRLQGKKQRSQQYHKDYMRDYRRTMQDDPLQRLIHNTRSRMRIAIQHQGLKKNSKTEQTLGCSFEFFRGWLESQFTEGMTWDNYRYDGWHVDHVIPTHVFALSNPRARLMAFNYKNSRPLWGQPNMIKNGKLDLDLVEQYNLQEWLKYLKPEFLQNNLIPFPTQKIA